MWLSILSFISLLYSTYCLINYYRRQKKVKYIKKDGFFKTKEIVNNSKTETEAIMNIKKEYNLKTLEATEIFVNVKDDN